MAKAGTNDDGVSATELATMLGLSLQTVTDWKAEGMPHRMKSGRPAYVLREVVRWLREKERKNAAPMDKESEQLRKLRAEADLKEIEVAAARGDLIPAALFEKTVALEHERMRGALLKMPSTFAHLVADRTGCAMGAAQSLLADLADQTLTELQRGEVDDDTQRAA